MIGFIQPATSAEDSDTGHVRARSGRDVPERVVRVVGALGSVSGGYALAVRIVCERLCALTIRDLGCHRC